MATDNNRYTWAPCAPVASRGHAAPIPRPNTRSRQDVPQQEEKRAPGATEFLGPKKRLIQQATDGGWWLNDKLWPVTASGRRLTDTGWPVTAGSWPLTGRPSPGTRVPSQEEKKENARVLKERPGGCPGRTDGHWRRGNSLSAHTTPTAASEG
eukprot:CAMPEP_0174364834 /NCGR_PEP_ID=MMETSP0811_2-20130205/74646_1 /TAXON_ID=73025 ORGANISM="Eutreptiella gymnastica-like, Strain CCMP1594" /NCGR_SAMPLE_ID=MMETSP0811_2 /ASSEMBLY_ACC=CAM_ASM_000667 /LENGTH=152 /DNA_ID=CAMNT_0015504895 /DNA_START=418 /DNA_END=874 /DNA_ORIENTATION=+